MALNVISYGGGVQSTAMVVLAAKGKITATHALFANTGDDSENPDTLTYVRDVMTPWAAQRGIEVVELGRVVKGQRRTLYRDLMGERARSIDIPMYMDGGAPGHRSCTHHFKLDVIGRWVRANGATREAPATVHIGISMDEIERMGNKRAEWWEAPSYPLIDLRLSRQDCANIIAAAGLPVPPKSACWFCPFKRVQQWREMRRDSPDLFQRAAELEGVLNERRAMLGKDNVFLCGNLRPLSQLQEAQPMLFSEETFCDSGYCMV